MPNDIAKIKSLPGVEFDMTGEGSLSPTSRLRNATFLCTLEWTWTPANERQESYYLTASRKHWNLWIKRYDDNYGRWEKPFVTARC
jgi:hypothetical protein